MSELQSYESFLATLPPHKHKQALATLARPSRAEFEDWLPQIMPTFTWDWPHLRYVYQRLRRVTRGECRRLMIFMPPRHGKSACVTMRYPVWRLIGRPDLRVIIGAYNHELALEFSGFARNLARECGLLGPTSVAAHDWRTTAGGGIRAVGVGSGVTGRGANLIIIDDPVKSREEAESEAYRRRVWNWYRDDMYTRLEPNGAVILIQTRWHCLAECAILTDMGITQVQSIQSGQTVLTSAGPQKVVAVASRPHRGDVVSIQVYGYPHPIKATPEHRILTVDGWKEAGQIHPGDWLPFPVPQGETGLDDLRSLIPPPPAPRVKGRARNTGEKGRVSKERLTELLGQGKTYQEIANLLGYKAKQTIWEYATLWGLNPPGGNVMGGDPVADPDFWRVVGYWLAEGTLTEGRKGSKRVVRFTFGYSEQHLVEDVREVLGRYGLCVNHHNVKNAQSGFSSSRQSSSINVTCSSSQLSALLSRFGHGAHGKCLPEWAVTLPPDLAKQLVSGYATGDGYATDAGAVNGGGWVRIGSVSLALLNGFQRLLLRLGVTGLIMAAETQKRPAYELRFPSASAPWLGYEGRPIEQRSQRIEGNRLLVKVKTVGVEEYDGLVYDIQTPCHDFLAHNMIVHNCDDLAGRLLAEAASGGEAWEVINLPALADEGDPLGRQPGEALCPERFSVADLERVRTVLGTYSFEALYQQRPRPQAGALMKREWLGQIARFIDE